MIAKSAAHADRIFDLRAGERARAAGLFAVSFAFGFGLSAMEIAIQTSLLASGSPDNIPWAQVAVGVTVFSAGGLLSVLRARLSPAVFVGAPVALLGAVALLVLPQIVGAAPGLSGLLGLIASHGVLSALAMVAFWTLAARAFDIEQSRRLYGLVSAGELVGIVVAGLLAAPMRHWFDLPALLALSLALVTVTGLALLPFARSVHGSAPHETEEPAAATAPLECRHVSRCVSYYSAYNLSYYLIEYTLFIAIQRAWAGEPESIAGALGAVSAARVAIGVGFRLFLTGRLLSRFGLGLGLSSGPVAVLAMCAIGLMAYPLAGSVLVAAFALSVVESAARNALGKPAFMAAQRPLSRAPRERTLTRIETVVEPLTTGLAGASILLLPAAWFAGPALLLVPVPTALAWLAASAALGRSYRRLLSPST